MGSWHTKGGLERGKWKVAGGLARDTERANEQMNEMNRFFNKNFD